MIEKQTLQTGHGDWTVLKKNDEICIVDAEGRCRHQSRGHINTAVYLAAALAERPMLSDENADTALRAAVAQFKESDSSPDNRPASL